MYNFVRMNVHIIHVSCSRGCIFWHKHILSYLIIPESYYIRNSFCIWISTACIIIFSTWGFAHTAALPVHSWVALLQCANWVVGPTSTCRFLILGSSRFRIGILYLYTASMARVRGSLDRRILHFIGIYILIGAYDACLYRHRMPVLLMFIFMCLI